MIAFYDSDPPWEQVWISEEDCHPGGAGDVGVGHAGDGGAGEDDGNNNNDDEIMRMQPEGKPDGDQGRSTEEPRGGRERRRWC